MKNDDFKLYVVALVFSVILMACAILIVESAYDRRFEVVDTSNMSEEQIELLERWME